jgi:hypothetical protein
MPSLTLLTHDFDRFAAAFSGAARPLGPSVEEGPAYRSGARPSSSEAISRSSLAGSSALTVVSKAILL